METAPQFRESDSSEVEDRLQPAIVAFLSNPANYPHMAGSVSQIGTHAAIIFLAGSKAYKLKRSVKLPYLDFSTVEKRRDALKRELEINSQTAPGLYLSVIPITHAPDGAGFELGGNGKPADWVLTMRRFEQDALFDSIACRGKLERAHAIELAHTIERFHRQAPRMLSAGFAQHVEKVVADLSSALCSESAMARGLDAASYIERLRKELEARLPLMVSREREGFVRRCHGDLHLKNIVLWEGKPRLFDAIEFDDSLAAIDVMYDLAFLLMDLWHRGLRHEANSILNHYLQRAAMSELIGLALLPLFLSLRAAIRSMTGLHALAHPGTDAQVREIEGYAQLADSLLSSPRPSLVAIGGISGTGKSAVAREAAPLIGAVPGALHLRTDVERKVMQGVPLDRPLPLSAYIPELRDEVYRRVFKKAEIALDSGHSVVVDAVFPDEAHRAMFCELAHRTNAAFWGFWLQADASIIRQRIAARPAGASDADIAVAETQMRTVKPPEDWIKIDASGERDVAASAVMRKLLG